MVDVAQDLSEWRFQSFLRDVIFLLADWTGEGQQDIITAPGLEALLSFIPSPNHSFWHDLCSGVLKDKSAKQCSTQAMNLLCTLVKDSRSEGSQLSIDFTAYQNVYLCLQTFRRHATPGGISQPMNIAKIRKTAKCLNLSMSSVDIAARNNRLRRLLSIDCVRKERYVS